MPTYGPNAFAAFANDAANGGTVDWNNPGNAASDNGTEADCSLEPSIDFLSKWHKSTDASLGIDGSDTITKVILRGKLRASVEDSFVLQVVFAMVFGGTVQGGTATVTTPAEITTAEGTFVVEITSGLPTVSQANNSGFGMAVAAFCSVEPVDVFIDFTSVEIETSSAALEDEISEGVELGDTEAGLRSRSVSKTEGFKASDLFDPITELLHAAITETFIVSDTFAGIFPTGKITEGIKASDAESGRRDRLVSTTQGAEFGAVFAEFFSTSTADGTLHSDLFLCHSVQTTIGVDGAVHGDTIVYSSQGAFTGNGIELGDNLRSALFQALSEAVIAGNQVLGGPGPKLTEGFFQGDSFRTPAQSAVFSEGSLSSDAVYAGLEAEFEDGITVSDTLTDRRDRVGLVTDGLKASDSMIPRSDIEELAPEEGVNQSDQFLTQQSATVIEGSKHGESCSAFVSHIGLSSEGSKYSDFFGAGPGHRLPPQGFIGSDTCMGLRTLQPQWRTEGSIFGESLNRLGRLVGPVTEGIEASDQYIPVSQMGDTVTDGHVLSDLYLANPGSRFTDGAVLGDSLFTLIAAVGLTTEGFKASDLFHPRTDTLDPVSEGSKMGDSFVPNSSRSFGYIAIDKIKVGRP